jgi:hypothetical protein
MITSTRNTNMNYGKLENLSESEETGKKEGKSRRKKWK